MKKLIGGGLIAIALGLSSVALAPTASAYNQDTVAQFVAVVDYEAERWGTGPVRVTIGHFDDNEIIAGTNASGIMINANWAALDPDRFNALIAEDVAVGAQPGGCTGIQAVAIHEMGHVIDRRRGQIARRTVAQAADAGQVGTDLHGYAFENGEINPGEAVAVSFQAVECGSATPTETSVYNVLVSN